MGEMYRRRLTVSLLAVVLCCAFVSLAGATTYYVDSVAGNDNNGGTSSGSPWQNLTKVNTITFAAGDQILLKCGSVWNGQQLYPKGSGSSGNPIVINSYSTGAKPLINGQGAFQEAVLLSNQQYWELNNLEVTNYASAGPGIRQGVHVLNTDAGTLNHIYLLTLDVHDVNGAMSTGGDKGKCNGGILMEVAGTATPSKFNDILVQGCNIHDLSRTCIKFFSSWGSFCTNPTVLLSTNVVVRNNVVTNYAGDGICAHFSTGAITEYNVSSGGCTNLDLANVPIWFWDNQNSVIQYNEAYGTVQTRDGMAWDVDGCTSGNVLQYNYSHDNAGGFVMFVSSPDCAAKNYSYVRLPYCSNNIARYNISQRDGTRVLRFSGKINDNYVYNNTMYIGAGTAKTVDSGKCGSTGPTKQGPVNTYLYNNIIYNTEASGAAYTFVGTNYVWDYNVFYGNHPAGEPSDAHKLTSDPLLVNPGSGGTGRLTVDGYKLQSGSPARDSGMTISGNGGLDYWGNPVPSGSGPDRGANEYVAGGSPPVTNFTGNPTSGQAPLTVMFTDTSAGNPTSWSWTFGDGGTSITRNPSHVYAAGTYTVSLTATNAYGSNTNTKTNYITASSGGIPPTADFTGYPTSGVPPLAVAFSDASTGSPTSWSWTFGDGGTSTAQNPSHTYNAAGSYTVALTATNQYGSNTNTKTGYINVGSGGNYSCTSLTIEVGTLVSGSHSDTHVSDDVRIVINAVKSGKYSVDNASTFETGLGSLSSLTVTNESQYSNLGSTGYQYRYVDVWNYTTNGWVQVANPRISTAGADVTTVTSVPSPSVYRSSTGQVKVRFRHGHVNGTAWTLSEDYVKITATP